MKLTFKNSTKTIFQRIKKLLNEDVSEATQLIINELATENCLPLRMELMYNLSQAYILTNKFSKAIELLRQIVRSKKCIKSTELILTLQTIGLANRHINNYSESLKYYITAIDLCSNSQRSVKSLIFANMGVVSLKINRSNAAARYLNISIMLDNYQWRDTLAINFAQVYFTKGLNLKAYKIYADLIAKHSDNSNFQVLLSSYYGIAEIKFVENCFNQCKIYLLKTKRLINKTKSTLLLSKVLKLYSKCLFHLGKESLALKFIRTAIIWSRLFHKDELKEAYLVLSKFQGSRKSYLLAIYAAENAEKLNIEFKEHNFKVDLIKMLNTFEEKNFISLYKFRSVKKQRLINAKIKVLRLQTNREFLFNTLSTIQNLTLLGYKKYSSEQLAKLARLMRLKLISSDQNATEIKSEIELLSLYLDLEALIRKDILEFSLVHNLSAENYNPDVPGLLLKQMAEHLIYKYIPSSSDKKHTLIIHLRITSVAIYFHMTLTNPSLKSINYKTETQISAIFENEEYHRNFMGYNLSHRINSKTNYIHYTIRLLKILEY